jgi:protein-tyrosine phosphatase
MMYILSGIKYYKLRAKYMISSILPSVDNVDLCIVNVTFLKLFWAFSLSSSLAKNKARVTLQIMTSPRTHFIQPSIHPTSHSFLYNARKMAAILRQIIAGPRTKHPESNLDLCYVTPFIIATSGPSGTYPRRAYRNPLDQLVKFLDEKHRDNWCIWEFRAEGTGYPDSEVYGRVRHYPWPDHHPPPFVIVPLVMADMRKWLKGGEQMVERKGEVVSKGGSPRVVVVHCKAGKGRSGTMACSYLISECGWKADEALARFTERRMRPGFGQGVSIPSQLRWVGYVDRWTKGGKVYVDRQIEILEIHTWGLRDGVKVAVEGYIQEGKIIKIFHVFTKKERVVIEGNAPGSAGFTDMVSDMAGYGTEIKTPADASMGSNIVLSKESMPEKARGRIALPKITKSSDSLDETNQEQIGSEAGGRAVIFKPSIPLIIPTSDINIDLERRNRAGYGLAMVTSVAHVWFNAFFEGNGPEKNGLADETGVFEIDWDRMDGIKGSLRKGTRALDRLAVLWRVHDTEPNVIHQPSDDKPIPQMAPADWKGENNEAPGLGKDLGIRSESPASADVSKASSVKSFDGKEKEKSESEDDSVKGVKTSGPTGEEDLHVDMRDLPRLRDDAPEPDLNAVNEGLDTASNTTPLRGSQT